MEDYPAPDRRRRHPWLRTIAWIAAVTAWAALSFASVGTESGESASYNAGRVLGAAVVSLLVGLVVRRIYVAVRRGPERPEFWSPWIFVIAAVVALLAAIGNAGD